jgi:hypothetical protein
MRLVPEMRAVTRLRSSEAGFLSVGQQVCVGVSIEAWP